MKCRANSRGGGRRGSAMVYTVIAIPVMILICALSVDWGRAQLVKMELSRMCDGAARYAATGIYDSTTLTKAQYIAGLNTVDGQAIALTAANVEPGKWDSTTKTFTATNTSPNAVRVTVTKTVPAVFARAAGGAAKTITCRAVAMFSMSGYGLIGLNSINFSGHSTASYWSGSGPNISGFGNIASNGVITIGGSSTVNGNVYLDPGGSVSGGTITGSAYNLSQPLSYPNGDATPYGPSNNDNSNFPTGITGSSFSINNKDVVVAGGHYYFNSFSVGGNGSIYGSIPGKTVIMSGTGDVNYDMSLDSTNGVIALVQ